MTKARWASGAIFAGLLVACGADTSSIDRANNDVTGNDPTGSFGNASGSTAPAAKETGCLKMDIVFTIDNSASMADEQANVVANFSKFMKVIEDYRTSGGSKLDYRIAILTTDADNEHGAFRKTGVGCDAGPSRAWLESTDTNLEAAFACRATVGTSGSPNERPLQALKLALTDQAKSANNGFLRPDALLAFVILTDEDETVQEINPYPTDPLCVIFPFSPGCMTGGPSTPENIDQFVTDFDGVKGDRSHWATGVIAGDGTCRNGYGGEGATDAVNLKKFVSGVGKNASFSLICTADLTEGLKKSISGFTAACGDFKSDVN